MGSKKKKTERFKETKRNSEDSKYNGIVDMQRYMESRELVERLEVKVMG